jgi:hypothetical protein
MPEFSDYDLKRIGDDLVEPPQPERPVGLWIGAAVLIAAAGIAAYFVFGNRGEPTPTTGATSPIDFPEEPVRPLGAEADAVVVPPLDESDAVVRELVKKLSSHPQVAAWLATDGLIRNFAVVVSNIADGRTPASHLGALRPSPRFNVIERGGNVYMDPKTYDRYNGLADAVDSLDPAGTARLYTTLKPRLQEAYGELGFPDTPFDTSLERVIVQLLRTPVLGEMVRVEPRGIGYGFADERLEALTGAQKQFLRFGPRNVRIIQRKLREIALALGISPERLPAPQVSSQPTGPAAEPHTVTARVTPPAAA